MLFDLTCFVQLLTSLILVSEACGGSGRTVFWWGNSTCQYWGKFWWVRAMVL